MYFRNITEIKAANKASGYTWFDKDALKLLETRIESKVLSGKYFIISEVYHGKNSPRQFAIRVAVDGGRILMVDLNRYDTLEEAKIVLNGILAAAYRKMKEKR